MKAVASANAVHLRDTVGAPLVTAQQDVRVHLVYVLVEAIKPQPVVLVGVVKAWPALEAALVIVALAQVIVEVLMGTALPGVKAPLVNAAV